MSTDPMAEVTIKLERESDSDGDVSLPGAGSEEDSPLAKTTQPEDSTWEVPLMNFVSVKCEYNYSPEREDDLGDSPEQALKPEPAERDAKGAAPTTEQEKQTRQPRKDITQAPLDIRNQCIVCHKCFSGSGVLKKHYRQHTGEKPYSCKVCDRRFTHNSSLQRHLLTHTGEKPYACSICQNRFTQESSLRTHLRTHTDEKPFECSVCQKRFVRKYHLEEHSRTHTADKPYACHVCQQRFTRKFTLRKHLRNRCGETPQYSVVNITTDVLFKSPTVSEDT